ncbi:thioesterase II family protein [Micromonospora sp. RP3T]|uniref:thioesterase II family protein n=1 Tax=Micromonospora sp. RP3T TaxID=2135446 RepID=UPI000D17898C|nr:alpha/beta fold hydrolase [Micromonospora sp. RP3T]PTA42307.1 thioesterase [Micromonospora sp. RP3T]
MPATSLSASPSPGGRLRLFCFHHAGGAASVFSGWPAALPGDVDVLPVQLPGREWRRREPVPADFDALIAGLEADLAEHVRPPYAFYGHSLGGGVAYRLAQRYPARGVAAPVALLVGACAAPHLRPVLQTAELAGEEALVSEMLRIGGVSAEVLRRPEWLRAATGLLRADLRLMATARPPDGAPLPFPLHLFHGTDDPLVSEQQVSEWSRYTTVGTVLHRVEGGHFFVREPDAEFFRTVRDILSPMTQSHGGV